MSPGVGGVERRRRRKGGGFGGREGFKFTVGGRLLKDLQSSQVAQASSQGEMQYEYSQHCHANPLDFQKLS